MKLFRLVFVDVAGVDPKDCPAVNLSKCPFVVVIGVDGKVTRVLGPGICTKEEILAGMIPALKPKLELEKFLNRERVFVKALLKHDSLVASIASKYETQATSEKNGSHASAVAQGETIKIMEAEEAKQAADIATQEAAIQTILDAAGLKRY